MIGDNRFELSIAWIDAHASPAPIYNHIGTLSFGAIGVDHEQARARVAPIIDALLASDAHYHFNMTLWRSEGQEIKLPHR